jgi:hypothetical protein
MVFDKYKNKMKYPVEPRRVCSHCNKIFKEGNSFCSGCGHDVGKQREEELESYKIYKDIYNQESKKLYIRFQNDALEEVGLLDHPKADKIFNFAWEQGHSLGYSEVYYWLEDIAELFD